MSRRPRPCRRLAMLALVVLACGALVPALSVGASPPRGATARIGALRLRPCAPAGRMLCGGIEVPLDYASARSPDIHVGFQWLPARSHARGTVLAVEGGPGYATTGTASSYEAMLGPLIRTRNLLLVNLRGTGDSTPIDCPGLQDSSISLDHQYGRRFDGLVARCARQLNHTWRYRSSGRRRGGWVYASDLFNTADSARDVAAVVRGLRIGRVDLYGDSYGSWFAQTFASRYPGLLRTVTLDSTYQVLALDPWYVNTVQTARVAFDRECRQWAPCATDGAPPAWTVIGQLARRLQRSPVSGETASDSGGRVRLTVNLLTLVNLVNNSGFDPIVYRDLEGAARALLRDGDAAPLLRLSELSLGFDDDNGPQYREFSDGLFFAVSCTDYPQLFDRAATRGVRLAQYAHAVASEPPGTFAPFTVAQWTNMDQYTEAFSACAVWPARRHVPPPIVRRPPLVPRRVPVLVMSGTADSLTPRLRGATVVTRQMGPTARLVTFANLTHVAEQDGDDRCPTSVLDRFLADPRGLMHENVSCAARVAPIHLVGDDPLRLADATPATPAAGNAAGLPARRAATVALAAVGDEISRWPELAGRVDEGLRGGTVRFRGNRTLAIHLRRVRLVTDATVSGIARWDTTDNAVRAHLTVRGPRGLTVELTARWLVYARSGQPAVILGRGQGLPLRATAPAP